MEILNILTVLYSCTYYPFPEFLNNSTQKLSPLNSPFISLSSSPGKLCSTFCELAYDNFCRLKGIVKYTFRFLFYIYECFSCVYVCVPYLCLVSTEVPGTGVKDGWEQLCGCWKPNPDPLGTRPLTAGQLSSLMYLFCRFLSPCFQGSSMYCLLCLIPFSD